MKTKTNIKAGRSINDGRTNHNQTLVRRQTARRALRVRTNIKAGKVVYEG